MNDLTKEGGIEYRGRTFPGYNKPIVNKGGGKHKMVVLAKKDNAVKLVGFGHRDYKHNYSAKAKQNYLKRSAGIKNKSGNFTKDDKFSANYWARRVLWPSGPATGAAKKTGSVAMGFVELCRNEGALSALDSLGIKQAAVDLIDLRNVLLHAGGGAAAGGLGGAIAADSGHRMDGAGRGALVGGTLGGLGGLGSLAVQDLLGIRPSQTVLNPLNNPNNPFTGELAATAKNLARNTMQGFTIPAASLAGGVGGTAASLGLGSDDDEHRNSLALQRLLSEMEHNQAMPALKEAAAVPLNELSSLASRSTLRNILQPAAGGVLGGGIAGALAADDGSRLEGAQRGALIGGTLGALGGGLGAYRAHTQQAGQAEVAGAQDALQRAVTVREELAKAPIVPQMRLQRLQERDLQLKNPKYKGQPTMEATAKAQQELAEKHLREVAERHRLNVAAGEIGGIAAGTLGGGLAGYATPSRETENLQYMAPYDYRGM
jgi:hypothetical protein